MPLRVPDSVWTACPREPQPAAPAHTCPREPPSPLTAKRNGGGASVTACTLATTVKLDFFAAAKPDESNENPTSIPFGRLQNRKNHAITSLTLCRKSLVGAGPNGTPRNALAVTKSAGFNNPRALASPRFRLASVPSRATTRRTCSHPPLRVNISPDHQTEWRGLFRNCV